MQIFFLISKPLYYFSTTSSLYSKIPKTIHIQVQKGFLAKLFSNTKSSPSYLLLKEMFDYLQKTDMLQRQFPFIKSDSRFEQNWMILHALLLRNRFKFEQAHFKTISMMEIETFNYNIQTYFFPQHGEFLNPHIPVRNFVQHFSQVYMKKLQLFDEIFTQNEESNKIVREKGNRQPLSLYGTFLRQVVYQDRVKLEDFELIKLAKYYAAHRKYLESLEWHDMLECKVKWGFEGDIKLIQSF